MTSTDPPKEKVNASEHNDVTVAEENALPPPETKARVEDSVPQGAESNDLKSTTDQADKPIVEQETESNEKGLAEREIKAESDAPQLRSLADDLDDDGEAGFEVVDHKDAPRVEELSAYDIEIKKVGAEVIFPFDDDAQPLSGPDQWTNLRWLSYTRAVRFCDLCTRLIVSKKTWFAGSPSETFETRKLAIYEEPNLILVLRPPTGAKEVQSILSLGDDDPVDPAHYLVAETVIDPMTCKLRLSPLTTPTSIESTAGGDNSSPQRPTCFELVTPTETVLLSALQPKEDKQVLSNSVGFLETKTMEIAIGNALYAAHCPSSQHESDDMCWKHQLVLGTLMSFVISGSQKQLEKAIAAAVARNTDGSNTVPTHLIDQVDEAGFTALHHACARRNSAAVTALIGAGASATIPLPSHDGDLLPIHLSAKTLDHMSLSTILSAPRRPDPNSLDSRGRTAMYLAATEGTGDPMALSKCISALEAWGGNMGSLLNPVSVLASRWKHESLGPVLANMGYRYPLPEEGISLGVFHLYPVHTALVSLRERIQAISHEEQYHGFGVFDTLKSQLRGTLQVLFEHGFEPNERLEGLKSCEGQERLIEHIGFTPLQILAAAGLDAENLSKSRMKVSSSILSSVANTLAGAADMLVQCGGRMNVDPPMPKRFTKTPSSVSDSTDFDDSTRSFPSVDRPNLKIEGNKDLLDLLGGKERLEACSKIWAEVNSVENTGKIMIRQDKASANFDVPGGSNDKSCAICWRVFGAIMNRKHRCRVSLKHVCEECSTKRIVEGGKEHRVSDGQFLLAKTDVAREKADKLKEQQEAVQRRRDQMEQSWLKREEQKKAEQAQHDNLFSGIMDKAASFLTGEDDEKDDLGSLQNTLGQTRDALNERGERLNALSEKTEKLMGASEDFAKMAKELERAQKGGMFW